DPGMLRQIISKPPREIPNRVADIFSETSSVAAASIHSVSRPTDIGLDEELLSAGIASNAGLPNRLLSMIAVADEMRYLLSSGASSLSVIWPGLASARAISSSVISKNG